MNSRDPGSIEQRRAFLLQALSSGLFVGGIGWNTTALARWFDSRPKPLPEGRSIHELEGRVLVNGQRARKDTQISASDRVEVGPGGKVVFAVGENAYILRERSIMEMEGKALFLSAMRVVTGAVLGVFGRRTEALTLQTKVATIGIRGTALYTSVEPERTYACTCYGATSIQSLVRPDASEDIVSQHHDAPRWILAQPGDGPAIIPAPVIDHTDMELILLEALVGREVPFPTPPEPIGGPQRGY